MIEAAAKLPPGPEAWEPIFEAYPEVTPDFLLSRRIDPAARAAGGPGRRLARARHLTHRNRTGEMRGP
jgi:hypothetical protein